ncbi:MAG: Imm53 family immunity protein [Alphaproteobacteria bacterium]
MTAAIDWLQDFVLRVYEELPEADIALRIEATDNPGWIVSIQLLGLPIDPAAVPRASRESGDGHWLRSTVVGSELVIACGPRDLVEALGLLRDTVDPSSS